MEQRILNSINSNIELLEKLQALYELPEISTELHKMQQLKLELEGCNNYLELQYHEEAELTRIFYNSADEVGYWASKYLCFDDIDDSYDVVKIVMDGREVRYAGWMPGMRFEYYDAETQEIVAQYEFPNWDH